MKIKSKIMGLWAAMAACASSAMASTNFADNVASIQNTVVDGVGIVIVAVLAIMGIAIGVFLLYWFVSKAKGGLKKAS